MTTVDVSVILACPHGARLPFYSPVEPAVEPLRTPVLGRSRTVRTVAEQVRA